MEEMGEITKTKERVIERKQKEEERNKREGDRSKDSEITTFYIHNYFRQQLLGMKELYIHILLYTQLLILRNEILKIDFTIYKL